MDKIVLITEASSGNGEGILPAPFVSLSKLPQP